LLVKSLRLLVLASGRGSHAINLIQATRDGRIAGEVVRVVSDRPDAPVLEKARSLAVPVTSLAPVSEGPRLHPDAERALLSLARGERPDLVALCGFMRLLGAEFLDSIGVPVLNVHPALLPAFRGLHAVRRVLEAGARVTGATVHFVDSGVDTGPILLQAPLEILPGDTERSLADRLLPLEHRLYVEAIRLIQCGAVHREGRTVRIDPVGSALAQADPGPAKERK
jgi:phosphoribosylglycinamide formyltransferase 1